MSSDKMNIIFIICVIAIVACVAIFGMVVLLIYFSDKRIKVKWQSKAQRRNANAETSIDIDANKTKGNDR